MNLFDWGIQGIHFFIARIKQNLTLVGLSRFLFSMILLCRKDILHPYGHLSDKLDWILIVSKFVLLGLAFYAASTRLE